MTLKQIEEAQAILKRYEYDSNRNMNQDIIKVLRLLEIDRLRRLNSSRIATNRAYTTGKF